jgi:hypothetical protein
VLTKIVGVLLDLLGHFVMVVIIIAVLVALECVLYDQGWIELAHQHRGFAALSFFGVIAVIPSCVAVLKLFGNVLLQILPSNVRPTQQVEAPFLV